MAFNAILETSKDVAKIILSGELDASSVGSFQKEVEKAAASHPKRLVIVMQDLNYMASAGVRVLVVTKQRIMSPDTDIYMVRPQEMVMETIKKIGIDQSVIVVDDYEAAQVENV